MLKINKEIFKDIKVLVIGDAMIDRYFFGKIERQSPEADVPVVDIAVVKDKLGGAANVALNIKKLGAKVELISCVGSDETALEFLKSLSDNDIISERTLVSVSRKTTLKARVYNNNEYLLRLDNETCKDFSSEESYLLLQKIKTSIDKFKPDVAILQDYNKGLFTESNIASVIDLLKNNNVKIAVDPKKDNFLEFKNVDLFKPNLKEISDALEINISPTIENDLKNAFDNLKEKINFKTCLITLSENGIVAYDSFDNLTHFPAFKRNVLDVSGAGDTVISVASLFLALGYSIEQIAFFSNLAGGITIEKKGVIALTIESFIEELNKQGLG